MSQASLEQTIPAGDRLLLDTTALIAYLNGNEVVSPAAALIIDDFVHGGRNQAVVSTITVMEVLIQPLRRGPGVYSHVLDFLTNYPNLRLIDVDLFVAQEAATQRASHRFPAPDALIIATGLVTQVGHLVTNDAAWKPKLSNLSSRINVCHLGDHVPFP